MLCYVIIVIIYKRDYKKYRKQKNKITTITTQQPHNHVRTTKENNEQQ